MTPVSPMIKMINFNLFCTYGPFVVRMYLWEQTGDISLSVTLSVAIQQVEINAKSQANNYFTKQDFNRDPMEKFKTKNN